MPQQVKLGETLQDLRFGKVVVAGFMRGWPCHLYNEGRHRGLMPILCGELVRDVCEEPKHKLAKKWGVSVHTINAWRAAIAGIPGGTADEVYARIAILRADPAFRKRHGY